MFMFKWIYLGMGALGGAVRGAVGIWKFLKAKKPEEKIDLKRAGLSIVCSAIIGGGVAVIVDTTPIVAITSGYAGIDLVEGLFNFKKDNPNPLLK